MLPTSVPLIDEKATGSTKIQLSSACLLGSECRADAFTTCFSSGVFIGRPMDQQSLPWINHLLIIESKHSRHFNYFIAPPLTTPTPNGKMLLFTGMLWTILAAAFFNLWLIWWEPWRNRKLWQFRFLCTFSCYLCFLINTFWTQECSFIISIQRLYRGWTNVWREEGTRQKRTGFCWIEGSRCIQFAIMHIHLCVQSSPFLSLLGTIIPYTRTTTICRGFDLPCRVELVERGDDRVCKHSECY